MLKALATAGAYTAGNLPITVQQNTNEKYGVNADSSIDIRVSGLTEITATVVANAGAAGVLSLQAYANGAPIPGAIDSQTVTSGSTHTFHIDDIVKTIYQANPTFANISLQFSAACTIVSGDVILLYQR